MEELGLISKLYGDASHAQRILAGFRSNVMGMVRELNRLEVVIPVTIEDSAKQAVQKLSSQSLMLTLGIKFDDAQVKAAMADLQKTVSSMPITITAMAQGGAAAGGGGGGSGATGAAVAGAVNTAGAVAQKVLGPTTAGTLGPAAGGIFSKIGGIGSKMGLGTLFGAGNMALIGAYFSVMGMMKTFDDEAEGDKIETDPEKMLANKRKGIDASHTGVRGLFTRAFDKTGLTHLLGKLPGSYFADQTYDEKDAELREAEQSLRVAKERGERAKRGAELSKQRRDQIESLAKEAAAQNPDEFGKRRSAVNETYEKQMKAAQAVEDSWKATGGKLDQIKADADKMRNWAQHIKLVGLQQISADEEAEAGRNALKDRQAERQKKIDQMRAGGDFIGAEREQAHGAALDRTDEARIASRHAFDAGDPKYPELLKRFQDTEAAGKAAMTAADQKAANDRKKIQQQADDEVKAMQEDAQVAQLESQGKFHQAAALREKNAIDHRLDQLQRAFDNENDQAKKAAAKRVLDEAKAEAPAERAAIDAREKERQDREAAHYRTRKLESAANLHPLDFDAQQRALDAKSAEQIAKVRNDPDALREAQGEQAAEQAELNKKKERAKAEMQLETLQDNLRAAGHGKQADVAALEDETRKQLEDAGDDEEMKKAIRKKAEARAKAMIHEDSEGGMYSSWDEYFSATHSRIQSGAGQSMQDLQGFVDRLEKANKSKDPLTAGKIDREGDALQRKAWQKIADSQTVGVIKMR